MSRTAIFSTEAEWSSAMRCATRALGHETFFVVGHDRGGRVAHRMALDHSASVEKIAVLDIVPTRKMYTSVSREFAKAYYHWFFLLRPEPIPEPLIGANPDFYIESHMGTRHAGLKAFAPEALAEYRRCFRSEEHTSELQSPC